MPLYEYLCRECDTQFERLLPMSQGATADCPHCGTPAPRILSLIAAPIRGGSSGDFCAEPFSGACAGGACACAS